MGMAPGCISDVDDELRRALVDRLIAWRQLGRYRRPICRYSPAVRRTIDETSGRFHAAKRTITANLERCGGRWSDPSNPIELVLHPDGDGFLILASGVVRPERWLVRHADRVNAMRFGTSPRSSAWRPESAGSSPGRRPSRNGSHVALASPDGKS